MESENIKVSIIVPIYNCEKYISQCARSLFEQTYENIEYIFIDDASEDKSIEILRSIIINYPQRKNQIKIIQLDENQGSATARNIAIENINGEFCAFCDSDDWIESTYIQDVLHNAIETDSDIIVTPFFINTQKSENINADFKDLSFNLNNIPINVLHFSLANKLFKSSLFSKNKDIRGLDGVNCWEDFYIVSRLLALDYKITLYNHPFYHYRKFDHPSLSNDNHKVILRDHLIYAKQLDKWFKSKGTKFYLHYEPFLRFMMFTSKIKMLRGKEKDFNGWKETFPEANKWIMKYKFISFPFRIAFKLAQILPTKLLNGSNSICNIFCSRE